MLKHTIKYTDFNNNERNEDFYFHLSTPEVTRLEAEIGKPLDQYVNELAANLDAKTLIDFLERIVLTAFGQKTSDGKSFIKNKGLREEFEYSNAYAELFVELLTNPDFAKKFAGGIVDNGPKKNQVNPQVIDKQ